MAFLDRLGLREKSGFVKEMPDREKHPPSFWWSRFGLFLLVVTLAVLSFPPGVTLYESFNSGEIWQQETLLAPFDFPLYKPDEVVRQERVSARSSTLPYFREVADVAVVMTQLRDSIQNQLDAAFAALAQSRRATRMQQDDAAQADSLRFEQLRQRSPVRLSPQQWQRLVEDYMLRLPDLVPPGFVLPSTPRSDQVALNVAFQEALLMVNFGVMDVPSDSITTGQIIIRDDRQRTEQFRSIERTLGLNDAFDYAETRFAAQFEQDPEMSILAGAFFRALFRARFQYLAADTRRERERRADSVSPTLGAVLEGEAIVEKGQRITPEVELRLSSFARVQREQGDLIMEWRLWLGRIMVATSLVFLLFLYLRLLRPALFQNWKHMVLIVLIYSIIIGFFALAVRIPLLEIWGVPVAMASVLLTILFDSRVAVFTTISLALLGGFLQRFDMLFVYATIFACMIVIFSVRDIKNRGQIMISAGLLLLSYALVLLIAYLLQIVPVKLISSTLLQVSLNSLLLLFTYPLLWVLERSFRITTDLSLLELSDHNSPLLRQLKEKAPGTYNHTLQVAGLAEACADAVGANALLTRVGALYHDVGKMLKAEYFVENQRRGENPHDKIPPGVSAVIISGHVRDGLEMAREYRLPRRVMEFIAMHHGTTRIEYFYRKALTEAQEKGDTVDERLFRYDGPRPQSEETAILMLADSVEAAARSVAEPTPEKLESLIDSILKARIADGQLDESHLTFNQLQVIRSVLHKMLVGVHHGRIEYPGMPAPPPPQDVPNPEGVEYIAKN